jgi:hypothetical protein
MENRDGAVGGGEGKSHLPLGTEQRLSGNNAAPKSCRAVFDSIPDGARFASSAAQIVRRGWLGPIAHVAQRLAVSRSADVRAGGPAFLM